MGWRRPGTSPPSTGSRTWRCSRPTTSARATPGATRPSSGPTTGSPSRSASTSAASSCIGPWRTRPGCSIIHSTKGLLWLAHTESGMRAERARALMNQACGAETVMITPEEAQELCPQLDLSGGGRYPVLGASYHPGGATARHDRVVWAYAQGAMRLGVHVIPHTPVIGSAARRRARGWRRDPYWTDLGGRRPQRGRRAGDDGRRHGRPPAADPDPSRCRRW